MSMCCFLFFFSSNFPIVIGNENAMVIIIMYMKIKMKNMNNSCGFSICAIQLLESEPSTFH